MLKIKNADKLSSNFQQIFLTKKVKLIQKLKIFQKFKNN
jgi:hypothetical protein